MDINDATILTLAGAFSEDPLHLAGSGTPPLGAWYTNLRLTDGPWTLSSLTLSGALQVLLQDNDSRAGRHIGSLHLDLAANVSTEFLGPLTILLHSTAIDNIRVTGPAFARITLGTARTDSVHLAEGGGLLVSRSGHVAQVDLGEGGGTVRIGSGGAGRITGAAGDDHLVLGGHTARVETGSGADRVTIRSNGADLVRLGADADHAVLMPQGAHGRVTRLDGGAGRDALDLSAFAAGIALDMAPPVWAVAVGQSRFRLSGFEQVTGGRGADTLSGDAQDNLLIGGGGRDVLGGRGGRDTLVGGPGADTFLFGTLAHSRPGQADLIRDISAGDRIDLHLIDANHLRPGNQAFDLIGHAGFSGRAGEMRLIGPGRTTSRIEADVNGDRQADLAIDFGRAVMLDRLDLIL